MTDLEKQISQIAQATNFSGVVEVASEESSFQQAWGYRDRANEVKNDISTRFATASGTKGFTALGIAALIEDEKFTLETKAISLLGDHFPSINPEINIAHLLTHTSGLGDHLDEDEIGDELDDFFLAIPVRELVSPLDYLPLIRDVPEKFPPGDKTCYCNAGYVVLSMIIEIVAEQGFHQFIEQRIFNRAGMTHSGFFRSDYLPKNTALGYLAGDRLKTNIFNLPVIGSGDGGAYTNLEDMKLFWQRLLAYDVVHAPLLDQMMEPQTSFETCDYGFGFYIEDDGRFISLEGDDAGVSFCSSTSPDLKTIYTVISNESSGVDTILSLLRKALFKNNAYE